MLGFVMGSRGRYLPSQDDLVPVGAVVVDEKLDDGDPVAGCDPLERREGRRRSPGLHLRQVGLAIPGFLRDLSERALLCASQPPKPLAELRHERHDARAREGLSTWGQALVLSLLKIDPGQ